MPSIDDYETDLKHVLIDAAADPFFREFMERDDLEFIAVDRGDGTQEQVQALSRRSVRRVLEKIIKRARQKGVDIKHWICSVTEFDLCGKLKDTLPGQLMRALHDFLRDKRIEGGLTFAAAWVQR